MQKIIHAFILVLLVSCGGKESLEPSIAIKIDSSLGSCVAQPCSQQLESFESKAVTWEVNIPETGTDLNEDLGVGQYLLDGTEHQITIYGENLNFNSKSSDIHIIVKDCDEDSCAYKDDFVQIFSEKNSIIYSILFYGTEEVQLASDSIPSADLLAKMSVSLEIYIDDFSDYLSNVDAETDSYVFNK